MKLNILLFVLLFVSSRLSSQSVTAVELRTHGPFESGARYPGIALPTPDKGAFLIGSSDPMPFWGEQYFRSSKRSVIKIDSMGRVGWTKSYQIVGNNLTKNYCRIMDACRNTDGGLTTVGMMTVDTTMNNSSIQKYGAFFMMRLKQNGDTVWCRRMQDSSKFYHHPNVVTQTSDSGFITGGTIVQQLYGSWGSKSKFFLCKIDKYGALEWCINDTTKVESVVTGIVQLPDSGFIAAGYYYDALNSASHSTLWRFGKNGNLIWSKEYFINLQNSNTALDLVYKSNSIYVLQSENWLNFSRIDLNGNVLWSKSTGQSGNLQSYTRTGHVFSINHNQFLLSLTNAGAYAMDSIGNGLWYTPSAFGGENAIQLSNKNLLFFINIDYNIIVKTSDSIVPGTYQLVVTDSLATGKARCFSTYPLVTSVCIYSANPLNWEIKSGGKLTEFHPSISTFSIVEYQGCLGVGGGIQDISSTPLKIFPNPAKSEIMISTELYSASVKIEIYDSAGKIVLNETSAFDTGSCKINTSGLLHGFYFVKLTTGNCAPQLSKLIIAD